MAFQTGEQLLCLIQEKYPGYHPIVHAAEIAHDKDLSASIHLDAVKTMLKYTTPDVKSIDISNRIGGNVDMLELLALGLNTPVGEEITEGDFVEIMA